jgi:creatinine amidohydrolase
MRRLARETTTTVGDGDPEVAVVPVGSVEQHGPALPLGTDFMAAASVARSLDRDDALVLPTVPVGVSVHHRQFDGTLWVDPETLEEYVGQVLASAASHGVRKAVVVNGHGGNGDALERAARRLRQEEVAFAAPWNWWSNLGDLPEELFGQSGIAHADAMETSMVYAVDDELVREDDLAAAEAGASEGWGRSVHGAEIGFDTADFSESGAAGRPTDASREAGRRLHETAVAELDALVDWLVDQPFDDLLPEGHR